MSDPNAVWPDGTRWAVGQAHDQWMKRSQFDPTSVATDILTALEPFVQQRIEKATVSARAKITAQCNELANLNEVMQRKNRELDALGMVWCDGGCHSGMHRWQSDPPTAVTIAFLLRNAARAWHWFVSAQGRLSAGGHPIPIGTDMGPHWDKARSQVLAAVNEQSEAEVVQLRAEVARLREDGERRQAEVLQLRALLAALPIGECQASAALQGWWDQMKAVMAGTNPVWLVEPRGCPTPGACSCPGVRLDAARSARGGEG